MANSILKGKIKNKQTNKNKKQKQKQKTKQKPITISHDFFDSSFFILMWWYTGFSANYQEKLYLFSTSCS